jgi:hypothetical protein
MYRYNSDRGAVPQLFDRVEIVHTAGDYDGKRATIGGFYDTTAALICLDDPLPDGTMIIAMTVVCLDRIEHESYEYPRISLDEDATQRA